MPRIQKEISRFQPAAARKSRSSDKRLQFESLEERSLLSTVPFYIADHTNLDPTHLAYTSDNVFFALYGQNSTGDKYYYFDLDQNNFVETGTSGSVPAYALDRLDWNAEHSAFVISPPLTLPDDTYGIASARMYFAMGPAGQAALHPQINGDGSVSPLPNTLNAYFDYIEFSLNQPMATPEPGNLNIDTTNVDQFGVPIQVGVDSSDIGTQVTPVGTAATRAEVITHFRNFTKGTVFPELLWDSAGPYGPFRIESPGHALTQASDAQTNVSVQTTLGANVATSAQTITVRQPLTGFPNPNDAHFTVQLAGKYGTEDMTVTKQTPSAIEGTVTWTVTRNGTKRTFSPGDTVRFVDEPGSPSINATQTTIQVAGSVDFPTAFPFPIEVGQEIMVVTGQTGSNGGLPLWTVQRGAYHSQATTHANGDLISYDYVIKDDLNYHFNVLIDKLFKTYQTGSPLMLTSTNGVTYSGTVMQQDGAGTPYVLRFSSSDDQYLGQDVWYDVYYPFFNDNRYLWATRGFQPSLGAVDAPKFEQDVYVQSYSPTAMAFNANGVFADNAVRPVDADLHYWNTPDQDKILANLENQLSAAINRGVALLPSSEWQDSGNYYKEQYTGDHELIEPAVWNNYAQFLHLPSVSLAGLNYGFPYDDQAGQASDIGVSSFNSVTITLGAWNNEMPPTQPPSSQVSIRSFLASHRSSQQSSVPQSLPPAVAPTAASVEQPVAPPQVDAALLAMADDDDLLGLDAVLSGDDQQSDEEELVPVQPIGTGLVSIRSFLSSRQALTGGN